MYSRPFPALKQNRGLFEGREAAVHGAHGVKGLTKSTEQW